MVRTAFQRFFVLFTTRLVVMFVILTVCFFAWIKKRSSEQNEDEHFMEALQELKELEGRDNALIHYLNAIRIAKFSYEEVAALDKFEPAIKRVLSEGWDDRAAELLPLLKQCQPAFTEIRKGVALDYAKNVGASHGYQTPIPHYRAGQLLCELLCVQGRLLESQGKCPEALDNDLAVLTMGRDFGARGATLIGALITNRSIVMGAKQISRLTATGSLDRQTLELLLNRLQHIRDTLMSIGEALTNELQEFIVEMVKVRMNHKEADKTRGVEKNPSGKQALENEDPDQIPDNAIKDKKRLWNYMIGSLDSPYWNWDLQAYQQGYDAILDKVHPLAQHLNPNMIEVRIRYEVARARLDEARLAAALELFKLDHRRYPVTLDELGSGQLKALPGDPFSGKPFKYLTGSGGASYTLWSVGPDRHDDHATGVYDPSDKTLSAGDITLTNAEPTPDTKKK